MKKNIIILFCALAVGLSAVQAQLSMKSIHAYDTAWQAWCSESLVQSWNSNMALAAFTKGNHSYFSMVDAGAMVTQCCEGIKNEYVMDIKILNDTVYFCGYTTNTTPLCGIVGCFSINDLYGGGSGIYYEMEIPDAKYLDQMVVYQDVLGRIRLMAKGKGMNDEAIVVEVFNMNSSSSYTYDYITVPWDEGLYSIVVTDNYVVLVSHGDSAPDALTLRQADRNDSVIASGWLDNRFYYSSGTGIWEVDGFLVADNIAWDQVAVAYKCIDQSGNYCTRIRTFDIGSMTMQTGQSIAGHEKDYPLDLAYIPYDNSIVLLEADWVTGGGKFIYVDYTAQYGYWTDWMTQEKSFYQRVVCHDVNYFLSAGYGASWFAVDKSAPIGAFSTYSCPWTGSDFLQNIGTYQSSVNYEPLSPTKGQKVNDYKDMFFPVPGTIVLDCYVP